MIIRVKDESGNFVILPLGGGDVSPEQIQEAVEEYLENNPIEATKEVYTAVIETAGNYEINIIKGSYDELLDAYNNGLLINLNVLQSDQIGTYLLGVCLLVEFDNSQFVFEGTGSLGLSIMWNKKNTITISDNSCMNRAEVEELINSAIGLALEGEY